MSTCIFDGVRFDYTDICIFVGLDSLMTLLEPLNTYWPSIQHCVKCGCNILASHYHTYSFDMCILTRILHNRHSFVHLGIAK